MIRSSLKRLPLGLISIAFPLLMLHLSIPPFAVSQQQTSSPSSAKQILVLYTYGAGITVNQKATGGFFSVLLSRGLNTDDVFLEYLDLQRNNSPAYRKRVANLLLEKYGKRDIGLIVTVHTGALEFLLKECKRLFPNVPAFSILTAWPELIDTRNTGRRILLRPQSMDMGGTLEIALKMFPKTRKVVFVVGAAPADKRFEYEARRVFEPWRGRVDVEYTSGRTYEEMLRLVATLPRRSIVIYCDWFADVTGRTFTPLEVGKVVAKAANAPVFCIWDTIMGWGTIGGSLLSFEAEGAYTAKTALDVLDKKITLTKPVTTLASSKTFMFDWQQLKRWKVDESVLPKGSVVINRHFTIWDYRYHIMSILAFCLAETTLIVFLIVQRRRKMIAEASRKQAEEKYRDIFNSALEGIFETSSQGKALTANPALARMLGYDSTEEVTSAINKSGHQVWVDPEERLKYTQLLDAQDVVLGFETQFKRKDGTTFWVSLNARRVLGPDGRTPFYTGFIQDITERKRAEEKLRTSEERFRQVAENVGDFIWEVDAGGLFTYTSPSVKKILDYAPDELVGKMRFYDLFIPEVREELKKAALTIFAAKQPFRAFPNPNIGKDGRVVHLETSGSPMLDEAGNLLGYRGVDTDTTERQEIEARMRQAEKMEALGTFTGGIAHDFNNILAAMMGFTELTKGKLEKGSPEERHLQMVMDAGLRGRELIKQMLTFSRQAEQEKKPLQLSMLVRETGRFLRASIPATISIAVNVVSESGPVLVDPVQMQQVLMNLCTNAAYAMKEKGGMLDLTLSDFSVAPSDARPDGLKPGSYIKLVVRDTGIGMAPEVIPRIFDPFFTTKKPEEGTGLGLSAAQGIIRQHDGYIFVESEPNKGSVFTIYLPKIAEQFRREVQPEEAVPTGHEHVLLVDDEKALTETGQEFLETLGYEVTVRNNSVEALKLFTGDPHAFDLIVTDQTMPNMTGLELAQACMALRPDIPVVLATGFSHLVNGAAVQEAGIRALVMKPLTKAELGRTVRKALDEVK
jgi:two-component system cell cycle sensor histidine kinase/response regulator CckA